jgi:diguanylate cyclase (GGDEF)-like protein
VLTRLLHDVTQPIRLGENESEVASVSASIGLTLFPQDGADAEVLMRHADQAMYQAKEAGRNCYQLFNVAHD